MANTPRRWFDNSQPQTLQAAVLFCYLNAALAILSLLFGAGISLVLILLAIPAYGIANDRKWGYWSGVVLSCLYVLGQLVAFLSYQHNFGSVLNLLFAVVLVAMLLHPQSRAYQRVWFH